MLRMLKLAEVPRTKLTLRKRRTTAALLVNEVDVLAEPLENFCFFLIYKRSAQ